MVTYGLNKFATKFWAWNHTEYYPDQAAQGVYSHTLLIRVCASQRGRDFEAPDFERGIHFRGIF